MAFTRYCALLAALMAMLLAAPASATTWGMVETPGRGWDQAGYDAARSLGVGTMRVEFHQTTTGLAGWETSVTGYDQRFALAAQNGIRLMPLLFGPSPLPADPAAFAQFTADMARRFAPGGEFWAEHPELDGSLAPEAFELWNEPDFGYFAGGYYPDRYARLVKASVQAARAANPAARFLIYGGGTIDSGAKWVSDLFAAVPDLAGYVDLIATHPYGKLRNAETVRKAFSARGVVRPVWITELGWDTAESQQAATLQRTADTIRSYGVAAFFYFQYRDWQAGGGYGLYRLDGTPKPAAATYRQIVSSHG
jgi:hypothetical protein